MGSSSLRIVVTGMAVTYPLGGVFWDYIQYPLGLARLGHDVLYLEDTERWFYDPVGETFVESGDQNARRFAAFVSDFAPPLEDRWSVRDVRGDSFGRSWREVQEFCRTADVFLNVSASVSPREEYLSAQVCAIIDSDPLYTQAWARDVPNLLSPYDVVFTFGLNVGSPGCPIETHGREWIPTRQPVVLDSFASQVVPLFERRRVLTTVASWEPKEKGPEVNGVKFYGKSVELERFMGFPRRSPLPMEIALSGPAPRQLFEDQGWLLRDPFSVSGRPGDYRDYLAHSFAEWSVAKNAYVATRSGWFSCRSACYLALGVPVIVQDTGFGDTVPTGEGVLAFETLDEATAAVEEVMANYPKHSRAAGEIAEAFFDSDRVLSELLESAHRVHPALRGTV
ncbi:MAG: hypothetical protein WD894_09690 [Pirellulales bacterium]